jgi:hypothetical protein
LDPNRPRALELQRFLVLVRLGLGLRLFRRRSRREGGRRRRRYDNWRQINGRRRRRRYPNWGQIHHGRTAAAAATTTYDNGVDIGDVTTIHQVHYAKVSGLRDG